MSIVVHSFISSYPFHLRALSRVMAHIAAHRDRVWLTRPGDIAAFIASRPELAV